MRLACCYTGTMARTVLLLCFVSIASIARANSYDPTRYGAIADDGKSDTSAIQQAIDECSRAGQGVVLLEGGKFIAGSLRIKSGVTLKIAKGAELHCSPDQEELHRGVWILAEDAKNVGITGPGKIFGRGSECFRVRFDSILAWLKDGARSGAVKHPVEVRGQLYTYMLQFVNCSHVNMDDILLQDSQHWTVHVLGCRDVQISKVFIRNLPYGPYTDGIDIDSSSNVRVVDCDVTAGDDAYCVKTTGKRGIRLPANDVTFERCVARSPTNGFKIGTETLFDISNVTIQGCQVLPAILGIGPIGGLTITSVDGAHVSNISARGIEMELVRCPILVRLGSRNPRRDAEPHTLGSMEDVRIENVRVKACTLPVIVSGIDEAPIRSLSLRDIHVNRVGQAAALHPESVPERPKEYPEATMFGALPGRILFCRHARNVILDRFTANAAPKDKAGAAMAVVQCEGLEGRIDER